MRSRLSKDVSGCYVDLSVPERPAVEGWPQSDDGEYGGQCGDEEDEQL